MFLLVCVCLYVFLVTFFDSLFFYLFALFNLDSCSYCIFYSLSLFLLDPCLFSDKMWICVGREVGRV